MIFLKRKNKKVLYKEYKSLKMMNADENKKDINDDKQDKLKKKKKEKVRVEKVKNKKPEKINSRNKVISIMSLMPGVGSSHISQMIYNYLLQNNKKVCLLTSTDDIYRYYDNYDFIVVDYGCKELTNHNEYKLSDIKIVVCKLDSDYLKLLSTSELTKEKNYYFNFVPNDKKGEVFALMEDYTFWCVPTCIPEALSKEVKREFARLLFK